MAGESRRFGVLGFGKQSAAGTPLANPTFLVPKVSGGLGDNADRELLAVTGDTVQEWGDYVQRRWFGGTVRILAHPEAVGLLLYHVMGAQAVAGAGPYTHTFTMADTLPSANPLTFWDRVGSDLWMRGVDCFINQLSILGASGQNLFIEMEVLGFDYGDLAAAPGTLPDLAEPAPRFKYIGSTVELEADSDTPVAMTNVDSVELVIGRGVDMGYGPGLTPDTMTPGRRDVTLSASLRYDSVQQGWDFYRMSATGQAAAGGGPVQDLPLGSADVTFGRHPESAGRFLQVMSNGQNWEYGQVSRPQSDPGGGAITMDVPGRLVRPTGGGTEVTVVLVNETVAAY